MAVPWSVTGKPERSVHHATKYVKNDLTLGVSPFVVFPSIQSHDLHVFFDAQNADLVKSSKEQNWSDCIPSNDTAHADDIPQKHLQAITDVFSK